MNNAITITQQREELAMMRESVDMAKIIAAGFGNVANYHEILVKKQYGMELGLSTMQSVTGIHMIPTAGGGKLPSPGAHVVASLIKTSGRYDYRVIESTAKRCEIAFFELHGADREEIGRSVYTIEEAARAKLTEKGNWKNHPEDMLYARDLLRGQRRYCPDVLGHMTVYLEDEIEEGSSAQWRSEGVDLLPASAPASAPVAPEVVVTVDGDGVVDAEVIEDPKSAPERAEKEKKERRPRRCGANQARSIVNAISDVWKNGSDQWKMFNSWLSEIGMEYQVTSQQEIQDNITSSDAKIIMAALENIPSGGES